MATLTDVQQLVDQVEDAYEKEEFAKGINKWVEIKKSIDELNLSSFERVRLTRSIYARLCSLGSNPSPINVGELLNSKKDYEIKNPSQAWLPF